MGPFQMMVLHLLNAAAKSFAELGAISVGLARIGGELIGDHNVLG
jgi:hypothetical protein